MNTTHYLIIVVCTFGFGNGLLGADAGIQTLAKAPSTHKQEKQAALARITEYKWVSKLVPNTAPMQTIFKKVPARWTSHHQKIARALTRLRQAGQEAYPAHLKSIDATLQLFVHHRNRLIETDPATGKSLLETARETEKIVRQKQLISSSFQEASWQEILEFLNPELTV
jgi:hypothetical protein